MKIIIKKGILFLAMFGVLILPITVLAAGEQVNAILTAVKTTLVAVVITVAIICWVITGMLFLTSIGNVERVGTAKKSLTYAIIGTIIAVLAIAGNAIFNIILSTLGL